MKSDCYHHHYHFIRFKGNMLQFTKHLWEELFKYKIFPRGPYISVGHMKYILVQRKKEAVGIFQEAIASV